MSTTPEDNDPANHNTGSGDTAETPASGSTASDAQYPGDTPHDFAGSQGTETQYAGDADYVPVAAEPRTGGVLSAETFALTGLFLLAVTVFSGQLIQVFSSVLLIGDQPIQIQQAAQLNAQVVISGLLAALTAVLAGLGLVLSGRGTRPWARWMATATLIVGVLFIILAAVTFTLVPAGAEPEMPPMQPME